MDYDFFDAMTKNEAEIFLENFLKVESRSFVDLKIDAERDGIIADFSIKSVSALLKWSLSRVKTFPKQINASLPDWIKNSESYLRSLVEFDEPSKIIVLRVAFYLGESFIRYSDKLHWSIGNPETAEKNMPVIAGFLHNMELAPMLIVENIFLSVLADGDPYEIIGKTIDAWLSLSPS